MNAITIGYNRPAVARTPDRFNAANWDQDTLARLWSKRARDEGHKPKLPNNPKCVDTPKKIKRRAIHGDGLTVRIADYVRARRVVKSRDITAAFGITSQRTYNEVCKMQRAGLIEKDEDASTRNCAVWRWIGGTNGVD